MQEVAEMCSFLEGKVGELNLAEKLLRKKKKLLNKELKPKRTVLEKSITVVQIVGKATQEELEFFVGDLVTTAIQTVKPKGGYRLELHFITRRNKTEVDIRLKKGKLVVPPQDFTGGGITDIVAFALRAAFWSLLKNKRNLLLLDEPFKNLGKNNHPRVTEMLLALSHKLKLQLIIVSHSEHLALHANKSYELKLDKKGITDVRQTGNN